MTSVKQKSPAPEIDRKRVADRLAQAERHELVEAFDALAEKPAVTGARAGNRPRDGARPHRWRRCPLQSRRGHSDPRNNTAWFRRRGSCTSARHGPRKGKVCRDLRRTVAGRCDEGFRRGEAALADRGADRWGRSAHGPTRRPPPGSNFFASGARRRLMSLKAEALAGGFADTGLPRPTRSSRRMMDGMARPGTTADHRARRSPRLLPACGVSRRRGCCWRRATMIRRSLAERPGLREIRGARAGSAFTPARPWRRRHEARRISPSSSAA